MHAISKSVLWLSHGSKSRSSVKLHSIIIDTNININDSIIASVTMKQLKWGDVISFREPKWTFVSTDLTVIQVSIQEQYIM